jgi:hypothetical protein
MTGSYSFCLFIDKGNPKSYAGASTGLVRGGNTDTRNHVDDDFTCDLKNGTRVKRGKWFYIGLCKQE